MRRAVIGIALAVLLATVSAAARMAELKPMEVIMKIDFVALSGVEVVAHAEWVAELVRCGECIHLTDHDCPISWPKNAEDYCSFGERRADNG